MAVTISGLLVLLVGLAVGGGGIWLLTLGGTPAYAIIGAGLVLSGVLLLMRLSAGLVVYGVVVLATLAWSIIEVGFDWWQLAPRGGVLVLLGLWLLTPWVRRGLVRRNGRSLAAAVLPLSLGVAFIVAAFAILLVRPYDTRGTLATAAVGETTTIAGATPVADGDWPAYGRTTAGNRYSPLAEITTANVDQLEIAWEFNTGEIGERGGPAAYQVTPLKVGGLLYLCTPRQVVFALDAATGTEVWRFDPAVSEDVLERHQVCRGVSYHADPAAVGGACSARIFLTTADARLVALDALTGTACAGFGADGTVDLWAGQPNRDTGLYFLSSPALVAGNFVIVGGSVPDNVSVASGSGVIRAFDVTTGALIWNFDTGNPDDTAPIAPGETYTANSPNVWSVMSADEALGLLFAPVGNTPPDQYGAERTPETERFSASVIALDIATGTLVWVFQTVHHDLWDMDVPAQPVLVDLDIGGELVPALVQATKQGDVYVLDRRTGLPIHPVTEVPAPQGAIEGDFTAPTQPVSQLTFMPDPLEERDMWGVTIFDQIACRIRFHQLDYEGRYTPPSTNGTLQHPGNFGVFNWGAVAVDPIRQVMFGTPSYLAFTIRLVPRPDDTTDVISSAEDPTNENFGAPYAVDIQTFLSPIGIPCQAPPWGFVAGADLRTGEIVWEHINGTVRDLSPIPLPFELGVPDLGGPLATAGGVVFMSGSLDYYVRAFDLTTGEELWRDRLPAGGHATPMSYATDDGRQFVVVVAGGHGGLGTKPGDSIIAYALPD